MIRKLSNLTRDREGSTAIEFAILAPAIFALLFGVFQVGIGMQAKNAMRSIGAETARYAVVEYQTGNEVTDAAIKTWAENTATSSPYLLGNSFSAQVTPVATPRVDGTFEKSLTLTYQPPAVVPFVSWVSPTLTYTRPIFVLDE